VRLRTALAGAGALALASLPLAAGAAQAQPLTCGYSFDTVQDNSTAIKIEFVPTCSGEAIATPSIWEWVPISNGAQYIPFTVTSLPNNVAELTYDCPGTAPDTYQVIANYGGTINDEFVSDDCGTSTEP
jgi:hypothetical protein